MTHEQRVEIGRRRMASLTEEERRELWQKAMRAVTKEGAARALLAMQEANASLSHEERSARHRERAIRCGQKPPVRRGEAIVEQNRQRWANMTTEERLKWVDMVREPARRGHERFLAGLSAEERSARASRAALKGQATLTPEQRSAAKRKAWATRRAKSAPVA
jgi:hypothetical protein